VSLRKVIAAGAKVHPPSWLPDNLCYETMMGSVAYGVSSDTSDMDVYGICMPPKDMVFPHLAGEILGFGTQIKRFESWQEHHVAAMDKSWDFQILGIVKFFQLAMENNPNIIDSLFTPRRCVLSSTTIGEYLREHRRDFLHKGSWHKFKGYAYSQLNKIRTKTPTGKRAELVEKYGYDCYDEAQTEFLTPQGWRRFDDVPADALVAAIDPITMQVRFERPNGRIDKRYSGPLHTLNPAMGRCVVTDQHQMLVSPCHRSPSTNYSYAYDAARADWTLRPMAALRDGKRSWYHVRVAAEPVLAEADVADEYLALLGVMVSEGTFGFRDGVPWEGRFTQSENGKPAFFEAAERIRTAFGLSRYDYEKETVWRVPRALATRVFQDIGHGSRNKALPTWTLTLSTRQAKILWDHMVLGDGSKTPSDGEVYYTSSLALADSVQAMMVVAGFACSRRGPYEYPEQSRFADAPVPMYQVYVSSQTRARAVDFKTTTRCVKDEQVVDRRVVCFDMPSGTLVTRSDGKTAFHGNCKFAYHVVRLLLEVEQILVARDIDLERDREQLKAIRRGEWTLPQLDEWAQTKEKQLEALYHESTVPYGPDEPLIRRHLMHCLETHYGDLSSVVGQPDEAVQLLRAIAQLTERYR
jgi:hypothetical protein